MPTGYSTKKTMTENRVSMLHRLCAGAVPKRGMSQIQRRQFNDLCRFGWTTDTGDEFAITAVGRRVLEAHQAKGAAA